jgi:hypothetical protein
MYQMAEEFIDAFDDNAEYMYLLHSANGMKF